MSQSLDYAKRLIAVPSVTPATGGVFDALEAIAARRELPVSTVAREQLLKLVAELREPAPGSLVAQVGAIVELAQSLQETIRSQPGPLTMASEMAEAYTIPPGMSKDDQHTD